VPKIVAGQNDEPLPAEHPEAASGEDRPAAPAPAVRWNGSFWSAVRGHLSKTVSNRIHGNADKARPASSASAAAAIRNCLRFFWSVAFFSGIVNLLMLAGPLYMLQVYDRVLPSRSVPTLLALSAFLLGAYAFQGILEVVRSRIVVRSASVLDHELSATIHDLVIRFAVQNRPPAEALLPVRDLDQLRNFFTGAGPIAMVDLPWIPIFLAICFLIHPWLGLLSLFGGIFLLALTVLTERASRAPSQALGRQAGKRSAAVEADRRNSETVVAMGMVGTLTARWTALNQAFVAATGRSSDVVNLYSGMTKVVRLVLQSCILGLGAYLVLQQQLSAGAMIAASIMMGRALAPIELAIANWRAFVAARDSARRLSELLRRLPVERTATALPPPVRDVEVQQVTVAAPGVNSPIVSNVNFRVGAGEAVGVIGPSGSGKTSLIRTLVGIWPAARGTIRFDGATLDQWSQEARGKFIGFVSQTVELFDDTVAVNIARMDLHPDPDAVIAAARAAGVHDMILKLPGGYDTPIGDFGTILSGGQRQRVALARALHGDPFLVVLDEPSSNLDNEGEDALHQSVLRLKARGAAVILIAHRPSALAACDKVLVLANGVQQAFGPRDEVLRRVTARPIPAAAAAVNLKVVGEAGTGER
jgi:ATP-binding cassette subfamily C protein